MIRKDLYDSFARLQTRGHKLTGPRRRIIEALHNRKRAFAASELYRSVADRSVSLASVYRTLDLLVELGLAEKTADRNGGEQRYIACLTEHHHHVICSGCGYVADVTECLLDQFESFVQKQTNFKIEGHTVEFHGYCTACQR